MENHSVTNLHSLGYTSCIYANLPLEKNVFIFCSLIKGYFCPDLCSLITVNAHAFVVVPRSKYTKLWFLPAIVLHKIHTDLWWENRLTKTLPKHHLLIRLIQAYSSCFFRLYESKKNIKACITNATAIHSAERTRKRERVGNIYNRQTDGERTRKMTNRACSLLAFPKPVTKVTVF